MYNKENIFAKMISGEIKVEKLYEDEVLIAINDTNPAAPIHILVIPKREYVDFVDFVTKASPDTVKHYFATIDLIAKKSGVAEYRIVSNKGAAAGQSVFHFHTHILGNLTNKNLMNENL